MLIALAAGACVGIAVGLAGGGGAVLAVPVLVYLLDQSVHAATTESLVIVVGASGAGAISHARHHVVCWRLAAAFAAAALPGSIVGTLANRAFAAELLLGAFAVLLLGVSVLTWRQGGGARGEAGDRCPDLDLRAVALAGFAIGSLTGLFGVGGGFAVVPALVLALRVPIRRAIATSLVIVTVARPPVWSSTSSRTRTWPGMSRFRSPLRRWRRPRSAAPSPAASRSTCSCAASPCCWPRSRPT